MGARRRCERAHRVGGDAGWFTGTTRLPPRQFAAAARSGCPDSPALRPDEHVDRPAARRAHVGGLGAERNRLEARGLHDRAVNSPDPIYRNQQNKLRQENCRTFAALHNSTTPSQRSKALETLKGYETDLRALMAQRR